MDGRNEPEIPSTAPQDLNPTPTFKPSKGPVDACSVEDEINVASPISPLVHFVLRNFAFAMFLISLVTSIVFFAVTWFTVV